MNDSQKRYSLDDELKRGYPEKPILKEEQRKILEKLLDVDRAQLSPEEQLLMQKLVGQLESDTRRVKEFRKRVEGRGSLSDLIALLQQDTESFRKPPSEGVQEARPATPKKPLPLSEEQVFRPSASSQHLTKPKPWNEVVGRAKAESSGKVQPRKVDRSGISKTPSSQAPPVPPAPVKPAPVKMEPVKPEPVQPAPAEAEPKLQPLPPAPSSLSKPKYDPVEVVSRYIRAWNQKAFAAEYECFSPSLVGMSKQSYIDRRMAIYLTYNRDGHFQQQLGTVLKTHIDADLAEILCTRSVREFHKLNYYLDLYVLHLESGQWRITGVTTAIASQGGLSWGQPRRPGGTISAANGENA